MVHAREASVELLQVLQRIPVALGADPWGSARLQSDRRRCDVGDRDEASDPCGPGREDAVVAGADDHHAVAPRVRVLSRRWETDVDPGLERLHRGAKGEVDEDLSLGNAQLAWGLAAPEGRDRDCPAHRPSGPRHVETGRADPTCGENAVGRHDVDRRPGLRGSACHQERRSGEPPGYDSSYNPRLQGERFSMKRRSYGRDAGLTLRILLTGSLLGLLYVVFAVVLFNVLNVGLVPLILIVVGLAFFQYFTSDKLALAASGAKVVERDQAPELHDMIERLCAMADLPKPRVAIIDTDVPNAFATGRSPKHAAVAVTRGLWQRLEPQEVEGVLAHELSHVANRDVLIMTVASFFAMLAGLLTRFGIYGGMFGGGRGRDNNAVPIWLIVLLVSVVTYFLSQILILAISRYREFAADRGSALITGPPEHLMSALQKISSDMFRIPQRDLRQVESMNAFFIIPASVKGSVSSLFMTHPPLEKRLAALSEIAREMGRPVA